MRFFINIILYFIRRVVVVDVVVVLLAILCLKFISVDGRCVDRVIIKMCAKRYLPIFTCMHFMTRG